MRGWGSQLGIIQGLGIRVWDEGLGISIGDYIGFRD